MELQAASAGAAGLPIDLEAVTSVSNQANRVAETAGTLMSQIEGIYTTTAAYVSDIVETVMGPVEAIQAKIEELEARRNPIDAIANDGILETAEAWVQTRVHDATWLVDFTVDTLGSAQHLFELLLEAPEVTEDVIARTQEAAETGRQLHAEVIELQNQLETISDEPAASPPVPRTPLRA